MPVLIDAQIDRASSDAFFRAMNRATEELGKSTLSSMQWAARQLCTNLSGQTKQVRSKKRKIVKNPDPRWKTDRRMAPLGVMGYKDGKPKFIPIYRTGEYGKHRFFDRKTMAWYDRSGGSGQWKKIQSGPDVANPQQIVPGIMTHRKRNIPYRGLAKKTWRSARALMTRGGTRGAMGVGRLASVFIDRNKDNPSITIWNKLDYARKAFESPSAISNAMQIAGDQLERKIDQKLDKIASKA